MDQPESFKCSDEVNKSEAREIEKSGLKREREDIIFDRSNSKRLKCNDDVNIEELQYRIVIHCLQSLESCSHEVAYMPNQECLKLLVSNSSEPVKTYPFKLESFEKESILCIDNNQSVLVSAPTLAGKNVVAEYAITLSLKKHQKVVYTTSVKAFANQKYREYCEEFSDVGLITDDVSVNPNASCLVMTIEILRNMLYRDSERTRELDWIIFDEIHCMRDKERGVLWEEAIILSPHNARFVFLSEKITNARQFAEWIVYIHHQSCHIIYTDDRPIPLQHFIFPAGSQRIYMITDLNGSFKEANYNAAISMLQFAEETRAKQISFKDSTQTDIFKIITIIMNMNFSPVIVFNFSKKNCETYANIISNLDFNSVEEQELVVKFFQNAIGTLSTEDQNLTQLKKMLPLLKKGIGVHHSGLVPILKETIEIMFRDGLIKVLFATETFSMGLNVLAKTVLLTSMKKCFGSTCHYITPREYVHMSGRAGRRGIDSNGIVIVMVDEKLPLNIAKDFIIKEEPGLLKSAFHLTYNMILNLLRVEEINPEYMLKRSFYQFQGQVALTVQNEEYQQKLAEYNSFDIENEDLIASYYNLRQVLKTLNLKFGSFTTKPNFLIECLKPRNLVKVLINNRESDWGVILKCEEVEESGSNHEVDPLAELTKFKVFVLFNAPDIVNHRNNTLIKSCWENLDGTPRLVISSAAMITNVSYAAVHYEKNDIQLENNVAKFILSTLSRIKNDFPGNLPGEILKNMMIIKEMEYLKAVNKKENVEKKLREHPMNKNPMLESIYSEYEKKIICKKELEIVSQNLEETKTIIHLNELICRKRVLQLLGYCDNEDVIQLKGRVGCELSCCDEILLTEMIFKGIFENLTPKQCCSLLSCFVCEEKSEMVLFNYKDLALPLLQMQDLAKKVAKVSKEAAMVLEEYAYVEQFKSTSMDVVYAWCNGATFSKLCKLTNLSEGSIIRCMKRLDELLRQMAQASKTRGSSQLEEKFLEASNLIRRDIIFAPSLYL